MAVVAGVSLAPFNMGRSSNAPLGDHFERRSLRAVPPALALLPRRLFALVAALVLLCGVFALRFLRRLLLGDYEAIEAKPLVRQRLPQQRLVVLHPLPDRGGVRFERC